MAIKNLGRVVGLSAYETWLAQGNDGTEEDFLATLKGEKGDKGEIGPQGPQGEQGPEGRGAQADWSQNDENADSYIKNRPFYEVSEKVTVFDNITVTFDDNYGYSLTTEQQNIYSSNFTEMETDENNNAYIDVIWNGKSYIGRGYFETEELMFIFTINTDEGTIQLYPRKFLISYNEGVEPTLNNTLSVYKNGESITVKIDEKFLPDSVTAQPDWNENDESSPSHIKNRPFYEAMADVTILEKAERTTEMINYDWGQGITIEDDKATIIETDSTKSYKLTIDGKTYTGTMNRNANVETEDYGVIEIAPYWLYFQDYYSDPITVTIEFIVSAPGEIVTIPEKYLPDTIATKEYVDQAIGTALEGSY